MEEKHSIKGGRIEGVAWIVCKGGKLVIEKRPEHLPGASVCIPCGHIDLDRDKGDHAEAAFLRESQEEFSEGKFKPGEYHYLASLKFEEDDGKGGMRKLLLHYFVVTTWSGKIPSHSVEHGKRHSELIWFPLAGFKRLPQSCDREAIKTMLKAKEKNQ
jgi:hypothetical protein